MSFSQFIKISQTFGHYRQNNTQNNEHSYNNIQKNLKYSTSRPKTTKDKKLSTYGFLRKKNNLKIKINENLENNLMPIKNTEDYNEIFENIILLLKNIINDNKENGKQLCTILKTIYNFIDSLDINNNIQSENFSTLMTNKSTKRIKKSSTCNTSKKFELKNKEIQKNEYDYLIYINELHKKLFKLQHELNVKSAIKRTTKENINLLFKLDPSKYYSMEQLKIRSTSFTINAQKEQYGINKLLENGKKKRNLKISLKDIFNDIEKNEKDDVKFYNNEKYLLSHPRLNFNGYIHNNNGRLSSIVNERINRIPKEAFGVNLHTKLQLNCKSHLQLTFNPIKFRYEKLQANKNLKTAKL